MKLKFILRTRLRCRWKLLYVERMLKEAVFISVFHHGLWSTHCFGWRMQEARGTLQHPQLHARAAPRRRCTDTAGADGTAAVTAHSYAQGHAANEHSGLGWVFAALCSALQRCSCRGFLEISSSTSPWAVVAYLHCGTDVPSVKPRITLQSQHLVPLSAIEILLLVPVGLVVHLFILLLFFFLQKIKTAHMIE